MAVRASDQIVEVAQRAECRGSSFWNAPAVLGAMLVPNLRRVRLERAGWQTCLRASATP